MIKKLSPKINFVLGTLMGYGILGISYVNADSGSGGSGGAGGSIVITPPFSGTITDVLDRLTSFLAAVAIPITTIMILIGAFQMLTSGGNAEQFRKGTKTITYAVVGLIVVLLGRGSIALIKQLVTGNTS